MVVREVVRWILDRVLVAFACAFLVMYGPSFGVDLANRSLLYSFEVFLIVATALGGLTFLIVPRRKPKTPSR